MRSHWLLMFVLVTFFSAAAVRNAAAQPKYTITDLGTLGGDSSFATSINNSGHVTGYSYPSANQSIHAFYYDGQMHDLGALGASASSDTFSVGSKINDSDQVAGTTLDVSGNAQAFLWDAHYGMQSLGLPNTHGVAINNLGQIVGGTSSITFGQVSQAFLWDAKTGVQWLPLLAGCTSMSGNGVNDSGTVVGYCESPEQAFVWDNFQGT